MGFWAAAQMASGPELTLGGAALGLALVFFLVSAPCIGVGAYLLVKGRKEAAELAEVEKERKLLNIVLSRGQASISDLVLELGTTSDQVKAWIYDLVGKGLFSGYINWKDGIPVSYTHLDVYKRQRTSRALESRAGDRHGLTTIPHMKQMCIRDSPGAARFRSVRRRYDVHSCFVKLTADHR